MHAPPQPRQALLAVLLTVAVGASPSLLGPADTTVTLAQHCPRSCLVSQLESLAALCNATVANPSAPPHSGAPPQATVLGCAVISGRIVVQCGCNIVPAPPTSTSGNTLLGVSRTIVLNTPATPTYICSIVPNGREGLYTESPLGFQCRATTGRCPSTGNCTAPVATPRGLSTEVSLYGEECSTSMRCSSTSADTTSASCSSYNGETFSLSFLNAPQPFGPFLQNPIDNVASNMSSPLAVIRTTTVLDAPSCNRSFGLAATAQSFASYSIGWCSAEKYCGSVGFCENGLCSCFSSADKGYWNWYAAGAPATTPAVFSTEQCSFCQRGWDITTQCRSKLEGLNLLVSALGASASVGPMLISMVVVVGLLGLRARWKSDEEYYHIPGRIAGHPERQFRPKDIPPRPANSRGFVNLSEAAYRSERNHRKWA